ncbi:hypothetical protein OM076_36190 [Solirubrobacter ginsenosidimutans]|uniref:Uncharacterized protein n=1 Tax=Solirubrobacter ginsenosidimutans TaxID=490573 RepID=A0A9X3SA86_9ACTN|nr:hypothetical protein [Solirubrobacter ginsenosidimutans]MDA0165763.1 hypothetical protein [Solirubrobacter ginsenosidimutans]
MSAEPPITVAPGLAWCAFAIDRNPLRRSPRTLRRRLNTLSDRHGGARAITQSTREIPQAYRARYGIERSPAEELTIKRLIRGQYRSRGVLRDALLLATVDTEVGVWALDADRVSGAPHIVDDTVADDAGTLAPLFADPKSVTRATRRLVLYAVTAPGIPDLAIEEALYAAWDVLSAQGPHRNY